MNAVGTCELRPSRPTRELWRRNITSGKTSCVFSILSRHIYLFSIPCKSSQSLRPVCTMYQGRNQNVNWGVNIHILLFCPTSFFSNQIQISQFEKKSVGHVGSVGCVYLIKERRKTCNMFVTWKEKYDAMIKVYTF